jgi:hypothetical protein
MLTLIATLQDIALQVWTAHGGLGCWMLLIGLAPLLCLAAAPRRDLEATEPVHIWS